MPAPDPWPTIHAERSALADDLATLTDEQWQARSLCAGMTVREVLAHLTATAKMTPPAFFAKMVRAGFSFERMSDREVARESAGTPQAGLAEFRRVTTRRSGPPGPVDSWLGEILVHGEDIRRPLGIERAYPMPAVLRVADFYKRSNMLIGAKKRIAGLRLQATDTEWSTGKGPEVSGPAMSLVLAMTGRAAALADLSGGGVDTLRSRL